MIKYCVALVILIAIAFGGYSIFSTFHHSGVLDYKQSIITIDGKPVAIGTDGTQYFGNDAKGDLNDDGIPDIAFIVTQNGGGSGTFFYAVVAFQNKDGSYAGSNAILLGDRVAPQTTEIRHGILIVNYADRKPDEPMAAQPSVGVTTYAYYDGEKLVAVPPVGPITIEGEAVCLPHKDTDGPQTLECAYGLKDDTGRYFALSDTDSTYANISHIPMNARVKVEGEFKLHLNSAYQDVGIIQVTKTTPL